MSPALGATLILLANLAYMVSHSLTKYMSSSIPISHMMLARFGVVPFVLLPLFLIRILKFKIYSWRLIFARTIFGLLAMACYFGALKHGDPGKVSLIFQSSTLWSYIFARLVWGEKPSIQTQIAVPVAFIGLWMVINPDANWTSIELADGLAFLGSLLNAGVLLSLKALRNKHDTFSILFANFGIASTVMTAVSYPISWPDGHMLLLLLLMAFSGFIGVLGITIGFKYTSASVGTCLMMGIVPLMYISGIVFFQETLSLISLTGVILVFSALIGISIFR